MDWWSSASDKDSFVSRIALRSARIVHWKHTKVRGVVAVAGVYVHFDVSAYVREHFRPDGVSHIATTAQSRHGASSVLFVLSQMKHRRSSVAVVTLLFVTTVALAAALGAMVFCVSSTTTK